MPHEPLHPEPGDRGRARADHARVFEAYIFLNDDATLRERRGRSDPYVVFGGMLRAGSPPDDWAALVAACEALTAERAAEPTANAPTDDPTA